MRPFILVSTSVAVAILISRANSVPPENGLTPAGFGFLECGKDYVIRFPEGSDIFKTSQAGVTETKYTDADGRTTTGGLARWNVTLSVSVFQVVRFGGSSFVLLRHPSNPDDYVRWSDQRRAKAVLAGPGVKAIETAPDGPERMKKLRAAAGAEIPTSETWINLNHAIAIAAVPTEDDSPKKSIKSITTEPEK